MKFDTKNLKSKVLFLSISFLSIGLTFYIFLSSAELIFNNDYPYIDAISPAATTEEIQYKIDQSKGQSYSFTFDTLFENRELRYFEIPVLNQKLELSRSIKQDGVWMNKGNKANYLVTKNPKDQDNIVIYFPRSWRTIQSTSTLKLGDFIFLKTNDNWNYIFRIESINSYSLKERFPLKAYDVMNITILVEDSESTSYEVIEAKIVSARGD